MNLIARIDRRLRAEIKKVIAPKRYCNICDRHFRGTFTPLDPYFIENIKRTGYPYSLDDAETLNYREYSCPYCNSMDRDRLYALYISENIKENRSYKILDIAPSNSLRKYLKANSKIKYKSADLMMEDVDDKVDLMDMNIYSDNCFDIFICSHVLEHVPDDRKALRELKRILEPNGFGIVMVPIVLSLKNIDEDIHVTDTNERWRRFGQGDHVRLYSKEGFLDRLKEAGFMVNEITKDNYSENKFTQLGLNKKSVLYIVSK